MNIIIENTVYSLFIYILLKRNWKNDIFIVDDKKLYNLFSNKNNVFLIKKITFSKNIFQFYFEKFKFISFLIKKRIFFNSNLEFYGNSKLFQFFFLKRNIYILEDGLEDYNPQKNKKNFINFLKTLIKLENPLFSSSKKEKWAKKIYLTGLAPIPKEIENKVEIINLKKLWQKKNKVEQEEILKLFNFSIKNIDSLKKKKYILFTQPLSEDKIISEIEKIELYSKILKNYDINKVVIKKHPRERTNYKIYFKNIEIIEQEFPSEFLNILEIKFEKAITIFSTAALTVNKNIKIDFYGPKIHPKILERFGTMDHIMKKNVILKGEINE